jgi:hypothetical protein
MAYQHVMTGHSPETDDALGKMDCFVRETNIAHYKKLIADSELDPSRDEKRHAMLLRLLAEEAAMLRLTSPRFFRR